VLLTGGGTLYSLDARIDAKLGPIRESLAKIEGRINAGLADLEKINVLAQDEFQKELPRVGVALQQSAALNVSLPMELLQSLASKFENADESANGYWPAVSQFVNYRNKQEASGESQKLANMQLPQCYGTTPGNGPFIPPPSKDQGVLFLEWTNCELSLDEPIPHPWNVAALYSGKTPKFHCRNCVVKYEGGIIPKELEGLVLEDCILKFQIQRPPTGTGRLLTRLLLQSTKQVEIPG